MADSELKRPSGPTDDKRLLRKRRLARGVGTLMVVFGAIQFIPVERTNPPVQGDVTIPREVAAVLDRACFDCHSNQTRWPWYSYVAPASWLVARDVREGREHLNLSNWSAYDPRQRADLAREMSEEVEEGAMPPWFYLPLHPRAKPSAEDKALLQAWARAFDAFAR